MAPGCNPSSEWGPEDFDHRVIDAFVNGGEAGILSAFKGSPEMRSSHLQLAYYLDEGQPFKAEYMIGNYTNETADYFIALFVNYQQRQFFLDGISSNMHLVSVKPQKRTAFQLKIDSVEKGGHDFILLAMSKGGLAGGAYPLLYHRANVFVEDCAFPRGLTKDSQEIEIDIPGDGNSHNVWRIAAENPYTFMEQQPGKMTQVPVRVQVLGLDKRINEGKP